MAAGKKTKEEVLASMDAAAKEAHVHFLEIKQKYPEAVKEVGILFGDYYLTAGYKRVARMFIDDM
jgi:hypothetical protein